MPGLREKVPPLGYDTNVLNDERSEDKHGYIAQSPGGNKDDWHRKRQHQETPLDESHESRGPAVEELARIERATHETLRFLLDARVLHAYGSLQRRFRPDSRV